MWQKDNISLAFPSCSALVPSRDCESCDSLAWCCTECATCQTVPVLGAIGVPVGRPLARKTAAVTVVAVHKLLKRALMSLVSKRSIYPGLGGRDVLFEVV